MRAIFAILLVALIVGVSPACATSVSAQFSEDYMSENGKGIDSDILIQNDTGENILDSKNGINDSDQNIGNSSLNQTEDNEIDTTSIVMQSTNYTCGPAALATVLSNMGINTTEKELADLAGTDESGTTMYGLAKAAKEKGLNAVGMNLAVDDLQANDIVFLNINGDPHYSVVIAVTENSVILADPSLGNVEFSKEDFEKYYSGNALVITDPNENLINSTLNTNENSINSTLDTNDTSINTKTYKTLNNEEMQGIKGKIAPLIIIGAVCIMCAAAYIYWGYQKSKKNKKR